MLQGEHLYVLVVTVSWRLGVQRRYVLIARTSVLEWLGASPLLSPCVTQLITRSDHLHVIELVDSHLAADCLMA